MLLVAYLIVVTAWVYAGDGFSMKCDRQECGYESLVIFGLWNDVRASDWLLSALPRFCVSSMDKKRISIGRPRCQVPSTTQVYWRGVGF